MRFLALAIVALAACAPAAASVNAEPPNPCTVVSLSAAAAVLKAAPAPSKPKTTTGGRTCTYTVKRMSLTVETRSVATAAAFASDVQRLRAPVYPFEGITDAYSADSGKELALWKNGTEVIVNFRGLNPVVEAQSTLASAVFASL